MPNILVRLPEGMLDVGSKQKLVAMLNATAAEAEQIPDDPRCRALCWIVVEEVKAGNWTCGGVDMSSQAVPVIVQVYVPHGVLDRETRNRYAAGIHRSLRAAVPGEARRILVSSIFHEVPDGMWGINESIWRLHDFARHAGYMHLQHLAADLTTQPASVRP